MTIVDSGLNHSVALKPGKRQSLTLSFCYRFLHYIDGRSIWHFICGALSFDSMSASVFQP